MISNLPAPFDLPDLFESFPVVYEDSLNTVLRLEAGAYNLLLKCIAKSLGLVEQA